jgi:hypothetical protein
MKPTTLYAIGRLLFGAAALAAPKTTGRILAGAGGAAPDAQAFLRGMGGREIGLGLGLLAAIRAGIPLRPWLLAGALADSSDIAGVTGAWRHMPATSRRIGLGTAGAAAAISAALLATSGASRYQKSQPTRMAPEKPSTTTTSTTEGHPKSD